MNEKRKEILEDFINTFCRFHKYEFGDGSDDWLFETEKFLLEGLRKMFSWAGGYIVDSRSITNDFISVCVALGHKDVHLDKNAKVLNYVGPVVFGFRFKPEIYDLMNKIKDRYSAYSKQNEKELFTENFIQTHFVYKEGSKTVFNTAYNLYTKSMVSSRHEFFDATAFKRATVRFIPQTRCVGVGENEILENVEFAISGLNYNKIQKYLNEYRKNLSEEILSLPDTRTPGQ